MPMESPNDLARRFSANSPINGGEAAGYIEDMGNTDGLNMMGIFLMKYSGLKIKRITMRNFSPKPCQTVMKNFTPPQFLLLSLMLFISSAHAAGITGTGASFPATVYKGWGKAYKDKTGIELNYQPTGSGDGIKQILAKATDFGASDMPLKTEKLAEAGLFQFPTVVGGAVPVINIAGIESGKLRMDGQILAGIFMGIITKWNAPAIVALNPGINLPNENINVIHRSDGSGTTFIFTNYLSKVSPEWKSTMGEGTTVPWKVGTGCRTNLLIPICLYQISNSISYMDYAYAEKTGMNIVQLKNHDGQFITPGGSAFEAAAAYAKWEPSATGFYEILTDEPGATSWPIAGATYILMYKVQEKPEVGKDVLRFFNWAYTQGSAMASDLGYVPLPESVQQRVRSGWSAQIKDAKGNVICPEGCVAAK